MKKLLLFFLVAVIIQGCSSNPTQYQRHSFTGGYKDQQVSDNVFTVNFRGNGFTTVERTRDFTMLRGSELTLQHGYKYFSVKNAVNNSNTQTYITPAYSTHEGKVITQGGRVVGTYATKSIHHPSTSSTQSLPRSSATFVFYQNQPNGVTSYKADKIYRQLTAKYGINKKLKAPKIIPTSVPEPIVVENIDGGENVKHTQKALNDRGYNAGIEDGILGPSTRRAIKLFQKDNNLRITGRIDNQTKASLFGN